MSKDHLETLAEMMGMPPMVVGHIQKELKFVSLVQDYHEQIEKEDGAEAVKALAERTQNLAKSLQDTADAWLQEQTGTDAEYMSVGHALEIAASLHMAFIANVASIIDMIAKGSEKFNAEVLAHMAAAENDNVIKFKK